MIRITWLNKNGGGCVGGVNKISRSGLDVAFGEGHGNMIFSVHKNMVILTIFTGGGCL